MEYINDYIPYETGIPVLLKNLGFNEVMTYKNVIAWLDNKFYIISNDYKSGRKNYTFVTKNTINNNSGLYMFNYNVRDIGFNSKEELNEFIYQGLTRIK